MKKYIVTISKRRSEFAYIGYTPNTVIGWTGWVKIGQECPEKLCYQANEINDLTEFVESRNKYGPTFFVEPAEVFLPINQLEKIYPEKFI